MLDAGCRLLAGASVAAAVAGLSFADGGYFRWSWPWAALAFAAAAAGAALVCGTVRLRPLDAAFVGGLAALAAWQALSALWAPDAARALDDAFRGVVYVSAAAAFVVLARLAGARTIAIGVVLGAAPAFLYGLIHRAASAAPDPFQGHLLHEPLGYANAVGILAAVAAILAATLLTQASRATVGAAAAAAVALSLVALALTESVGAWGAAGVGAVTALVVGSARVGPWGRRVWAAGVAGVVVALLASPLVVSPARLQPLLSDRAFYWPVAWRSLESPLVGIGSGGFAQLWSAERPVPRDALDAHSLPLETLLELGLVGLVVVVATLLLPLLGAPRSGDAMTAGIVGAYAAFLVHASCDWDWEVPAVTVAGLACGAAAIVAARPRGGTTRGGTTPRGATRARART